CNDIVGHVQAKFAVCVEAVVYPFPGAAVAGARRGGHHQPPPHEVVAGALLGYRGLIPRPPPSPAPPRGARGSSRGWHALLPHCPATLVVSETGTNSLISLPVAGSFSRTVPSKPALATSLPSGRNFTA